LIIGCANEEPVALQITSPENNTEFNTNLINVTGIVSDEKTIVTVNDNQAVVGEDGSFSAYTELEPGINSIETIATSGKQETRQQIEVNFTPVLTVFLDRPARELKDYTIEPLIMTGWVTIPNTKVMILFTPASDIDERITEEIPVDVAANGSFSFQLLLKIHPNYSNYVEAVATLGDQQAIAHYSLHFREAPNKISPHSQWRGDSPPGPEFVSGALSVFKNRETTTYPVTLDSCIHPLGIVEADWKLSYITIDDSFDKVPVHDGIKVTLIPSTFEMYPNTSYKLLFSVSIDESIPSYHHYWLYFELDAVFGHPVIEISVQG
jgi:hypothetical protein